MTSFLIVTIAMLLLSNTITYRCARTLGYEKALGIKKQSEPVNLICETLFPSPMDINWKFISGEGFRLGKFLINCTNNVATLRYILDEENKEGIVWYDSKKKTEAYWEAIVAATVERESTRLLLSNDTELSVHSTTNEPT